MAVSKLLKDVMGSSADGQIISTVKKYLYDIDRRAHKNPQVEIDFTCAFIEYQRKHMVRILDQYKNKQARIRGTGKFHPSQLYGCRRAIWFSILGAPTNALFSATESLRRRMIFSMGDAIHLRWQTLLHLAGVLESAEVPVENELLRLEGHADGVLIFEKRKLLEVKSCNSAYFSKYVRSGEADPAHKRQATIYMDNLGLDEGIVLYESKDRHDVKEFVVRKDKAVVKEYKSIIAYVQGFVDNRECPPREGDTPNCDKCRWCKFTQTCFTSGAVEKFIKAEESGNETGKTSHKEIHAPKIHKAGRRIKIRRKHGSFGAIGKFVRTGA